MSKRSIAWPQPSKQHRPKKSLGRTVIRVQGGANVGDVAAGFLGDSVAGGHFVSDAAAPDVGSDRSLRESPAARGTDEQAQRNIVDSPQRQQAGSHLEE